MLPTPVATRIASSVVDILAVMLNLNDFPTPVNQFGNSVESEDSTDRTSNNGNSSENSERSTLEHGPVVSSSTSLTDDGGAEDTDEHDQTSGASGGTAVNINPSSRINGFVLFGVKGSRRLRSARTRLAQIDTRIHKDDDSFFDEMAVQFKKLRGGVRYLFSIWAFGSCETVVVSG